MPAPKTVRRSTRLRCLLVLAGLLFVALCGLRYRNHLNEVQSRKPVVREIQIEINLYDDSDLVIADADVEFWPGTEDWRLVDWEDKWLARMEHFEMTGGCGCCNEVYTVRGPRAAIVEFPVSAGRLQYYPKWKRCLLYTSPSPRDQRGSRMPSSA